MMKELHLELPVVDKENTPPVLPSRYITVVELVDPNDERLKDIPHNPTDEEIQQIIRKYEQENEWANRVWESYIDEYRNPTE